MSNICYNKGVGSRNRVRALAALGGEVGTPQDGRFSTLQLDGSQPPPALKTDSLRGHLLYQQHGGGQVVCAVAPVVGGSG